MILYSLYIIFHLELHIIKRKVRGKKFQKTLENLLKK